MEGRSHSPVRDKRLRLVPRRESGKLSTKSPRLTSKGDRTLKDLLRDFATDKKTFINTSTIIVDLYLIPIKARKILNDKEIEEMFYNIRQVLTVEQQTLKLVEEELHGDEADVISIAKAMLQNLDVYGDYCRNLPKAISFLSRCRRTPVFAEFERNRLQANTLTLDNLLSYPFEQVKRYDRVLSDWVPFFRGTELYPDFEVTRSRILDYIDDLRKQVDGLIDKQKVMDIISTIDPSSIQGELCDPTTTFVKEGTVNLLVKQLYLLKKEKGAQKTKYSKKPEEVSIYLLSDAILVLRRKKNKNSKKKKQIESYAHKFVARIPLDTSRFIIVTDSTTQRVLQFVHEGISYAFLFDNERTWRDWQKKIKSQVKEAMKRKMQKSKTQEQSAKAGKRGVEWAKKYHTMDAPQPPVVKIEVDEQHETVREFNKPLVRTKHYTMNFNATASDVNGAPGTLSHGHKWRDDTFDVYLRPRAFTIASTEYSIVPESFPVVEEPEFGTLSFNTLKWAKVVNLEVDTPPVSPSTSKQQIMSPRISELVKKFSSEMKPQPLEPKIYLELERKESSNDLIEVAKSVPVLPSSANPIDQLSPRSLSSLYRPDSSSPRVQSVGNRAVSVSELPLSVSPPKPVETVQTKTEVKSSPEHKAEEVPRGPIESPLLGRRLGRSGSIVIGGRAAVVANKSNTSSSTSTPNKLSPRGATDPLLNTEGLNDALPNNNNTVSSPALSRGWTRGTSSSNLNTSGPKSTSEDAENNTNVMPDRPLNVVEPKADDYDYDPDWQFGFTQDGRVYYYNKVLNQRTWDRPANMVPNPVLDDVNAPHHWREMFSPQGYVYYLNTSTKQTSWFRTYLPAQHAQLLSYYNSLLVSALRNKSGAALPMSTGASPRTDAAVDSHWKEVVSPDGRRFYFNELTQTASWNPPANVNLLNLRPMNDMNSILGAAPEKEDDDKKPKRKKSKSRADLYIK